jgi:hypothetical protein
MDCNEIKKEITATGIGTSLSCTPGRVSELNKLAFSQYFCKATDPTVRDVYQCVQCIPNSIACPTDKKYTCENYACKEYACKTDADCTTPNTVCKTDTTNVPFNNKCVQCIDDTTCL